MKCNKCGSRAYLIVSGNRFPSCANCGVIHDIDHVLKRTNPLEASVKMLASMAMVDTRGAKEKVEDILSRVKLKREPRRLTREEVMEAGHDVELLGDPDVHPMFEYDGVWRFEEKPIAYYLSGNVNLNKMWIDFIQKESFTKEEFKQFYRDMGYSLCGFEEVWGQYEDDHGDE